MGRTIKLLTAKEVEHIKAPGMHPVDAGLYLQIMSINSRSWIHRYTFKGKARWSGLGPYPEMSLADARAKRDDERAEMRAGIDPVAERKRERQEGRPGPKKTFRQVAKEFIANHESEWKNPIHRKQWPSTLNTYAYPIIGDMPVDEITTEHVRQVLTPIWYAKPETARRVRGRIEKVLGFAKPLGLRTGENPARLADNLEHIFPRPKGKKRKVRHHPAMPYQAIGAFMAQLRQREGVAARCLEFTILCANRTGDVIGSKREDRPPMKWQHVDLDARLWTISATKNDEEHKVPLSDPAVALLKSVKAMGLDSELVFPSLDRRGQP